MCLGLAGRADLLESIMQGGKHSAESMSSSGELGGEAIFHVTQALREQNLVLQLGARTQRDADKLSRFPFAIAPNAFGKVAGDRGGCAAHLANQPIPFMDRITFSRSIDRQRKFVGLLPRAKLPIVAQLDSPMAPPHTLHREPIRFAPVLLARVPENLFATDSR